MEREQDYTYYDRKGSNVLNAGTDKGMVGNEKVQGCLEIEEVSQKVGASRLRWFGQLK